MNSNINNIQVGTYSSIEEFTTSNEIVEYAENKLGVDYPFNQDSIENEVNELLKGTKYKVDFIYEKDKRGVVRNFYFLVNNLF